MKRRWIAAVVAALVLLLVVVLANRQTAPAASGANPAAGSTSQEPSAEEGKGGNPEAAEQSETTDKRLEAVAAAKAAGTLGVDANALQSSPAPGWAGEYVVNSKADDWEPAVATDPNAPWAYVVTTRYGVPKPCPGNCPTPWMALTRSSDGGATWSAQVPLCACKGSGQFDPQIEVVPDTGDVYAAFMNGYNVVFIRSRDHGKTWSTPVKVYGNVSWNDKPLLAESDSGRDVYISFNGPQGGDPWIAQSHDGGHTWAQTRVTKSKLYYYTFGGDVTPNGRVVFSESAVDYSNNIDLTGTTKVFAVVSSDQGKTWKRVLVDSFPVGLQSPERADFYVGHTALASDGRGNLVISYDAPTVAYGLQRIYTRWSSDGGLTWSAQTAQSVKGEMATAPALTARGNGDVRMFYFQTAGGGNLDEWNVFYRASNDGGRTWTSPVKISDATGGAAYKSARGFEEPYGDYGELGIMSTGNTLAAWGEGTSYIGPGGVWVNRQT
ncbi:MAG TPA: sialidase family protein [Actinomycetota bacterium]|nr:sialidase family protein [Actinomycetota bacterium]